MKSCITILIFSLLLSIVGIVLADEMPETTTSVEISDSTVAILTDSVQVVLPQSVRILGVGDIMPGSDFPDRKKYPAKNGANVIHSDLVKIIQCADVAFCNLEGAVGDDIKTKKGKTYAFRIPTSLAERLGEWGFDLVSIANNHAGDCEDAGRHSTMKCLEYIGLIYSGSLFTPAGVTLEKDGITYGFIAVAPNKGCNNFHNTKLIENEIRGLDEKCDIVIVSIHGGAEGEDAEHLTKKVEYYMGENRGNLFELTHRFVDAGADIVFGHGPHVTRAIECYNGRLIAYSLGNFCTYGRFNLDGVRGLAPMIEVETDLNGKLISGKIYSVKQPWPGGPVPDDNQRVLERIIDLTEHDLGGGGVEFRGNLFFPIE